MTTATDSSGLPDAGDWDDEDACSERTGEFVAQRFKVECPRCGASCAPLCSSYTVQEHSGWRWVGCEYREPYATYRTRCGRCRKPYRFTLHTPQ